MPDMQSTPCPHCPALHRCSDHRAFAGPKLVMCVTTAGINQGYALTTLELKNLKEVADSYGGGGGGTARLPGGAPGQSRRLEAHVPLPRCAESMQHSVAPSQVSHAALCCGRAGVRVWSADSGAVVGAAARPRERVWLHPVRVSRRLPACTGCDRRLRRATGGGCSQAGAPAANAAQSRQRSAQRFTATYDRNNAAR